MTRPTVFCKFLPNEWYYMLHNFYWFLVLNVVVLYILVFVYYSLYEMIFWYYMYICKMWKTWDMWDMLNFNSPEKDLGLVSPSHFVYDFSRQMFLMLYSTNWPNSLSDCLYFSKYWAICVLKLFVSQAVTPKNLRLTKLFCYMTKK